MSLSTKALLSVFLLAFGKGVIIFATAGTIDYWQAWVYLLIFTVASLLTTIDLIKNDPELLQRRMRGGPLAENRPTQRVIMWMISPAYIALLVVPALAHRFRWFKVPLFVVVVGDLLVAIGFYFIFRVYRENTYTSATIELAENQKVIDTGPYAIVRHPMYVGGLLYLLGTPLALGSYWGLIPFVVVFAMLIWRIVDEEQVLQNLEGYEEYKQRARFRLLPRIW
jgi:protein-S-isoprenylcysteine O-methyltransferase Ste14